MKKKLNEKATNVLIKSLDKQTLETIGGGLPSVGAACRTCGVLAKVEG